MEKKQTYRVLFIEYTKDKGFAEFLFKVIGPNNITFHLKDRYSRLRSSFSIFKKQIPEKSVKAFPSFPKKKLFNKMDSSFLDQRMKHLEHFFNKFLNCSELNNEFAFLFFKERVCDKESEKAV